MESLFHPILESSDSAQRKDTSHLTPACPEVADEEYKEVDIFQSAAIEAPEPLVLSGVPESAKERGVFVSGDVALEWCQESLGYLFRLMSMLFLLALSFCKWLVAPLAQVVWNIRLVLALVAALVFFSYEAGTFVSNTFVGESVRSISEMIEVTDDAIKFSFITIRLGQ